MKREQAYLHSVTLVCSLGLIDREVKIIAKLSLHIIQTSKDHSSLAALVSNLLVSHHFPFSYRISENYWRERKTILYV